jgi:ATP-dependent Lon protease
VPDSDPLDQLLTTVYAGKVVRKDLLHQIKGGDNVPSYVLEYLLGRYCASDDPDEIRVGIAAVKQVISSNYFRHDEANKAQSLVEQKGSHRFIDRVEVRFVPGEDKYWASMDNFNFNRIHVNERFYRQYERLLEGGVWAIVDLEYHAVEDEEHPRGKGSPFHISEMRPVQLARFDLEEYCEGRRKFTTDQWIDAVLRSAGLEPAHMTRRLKLLLIARFLPFVEKNYNLIELGPRGTGKSYAFSQFSPYCILISGGKASSANLFYNNARRQVGLVGFWDVVGFDEVGGMKVTDPDTVQIMKDYMANGRFSRGITQVLAEASMAFIGNLNHSVETLVQHPEMDLFQPLPKEFDLALIDRFQFYLPGWEVPKNSNDLLTNRYGFVSDYLSEAFHALRKQNRFDEAERCVRFGPDVEGRDATAARKTVSGFLKILHPDDGATAAEVAEYADLALESRLRVKEQLRKRAPFEFSKTHFTFTTLNDGQERITQVPEQAHRPITDELRVKAPPEKQATPITPPHPTPTHEETSRQGSTIKDSYDPGDSIDGQFEVVERLGFGGFSQVYRVRRVIDGMTIDDTEFALKIFRASDSAESVQREIKALRLISHPRIVKVIWSGKTADGQWYIVSELLQGETLEPYADGSKEMSLPAAATAISQLLEGLEAIHPDSERIEALEGLARAGEIDEDQFHQLRALKSSGLVHRDIKPHNVVLTDDGIVLIDFGIASRVGDRVLTTRGTLPYQSPDIIRGAEGWDVSADLFAAGVVLYRLVCQEHPYENWEPRLDRSPSDPREYRPELPPDFAAFLTKACAAHRQDRFKTAREMRAELEVVGRGL